MNATLPIARHQLADVMRSRWVVVYTLFFLGLTEALIRFSGGAAALLSLVNVVLLVIPLVSLVFGTAYLYNARDFVELLLAQPVDRRPLFGGLYLGLAGPLAAGFVAGVGLPFAVRGGAGAEAAALGLLALGGMLLTGVFAALAFLLAVGVEEKARGLGGALLLWLGFGVVYDGLLLLGIHAFAAYPLEMPVLVLSLLNPIDLARVLLLLAFDISALMGYTGAVFESFFGSITGIIVAVLALGVWAAGPFLLARSLFVRKDF